MSSKVISCSLNTSTEKIVLKDNSHALILKFFSENEHKVLKIFLLAFLYRLLYELFRHQMQFNKNNSSVEYYMVDNKIIQLLIQDIVETKEYTLEGIAYHTRVPFDVIYDAACGVNNQFSITPWAKIVGLYMQVKPDIGQILIDKLLEIKNKHPAAFFLLLNE